MTLRGLIFIVLLTATPAWADEFRPAYLQLSQVSRDEYDVLWKVPALDAMTTLKVRPEFPRGVIVVTPARSTYVNGVASQRWRIAFRGGLDGQTIEFRGLSEFRIDILVRLARSDGTTQLERILPMNPRFTVKATAGAFEVVRTYTLLGIEHILTGFDHLLFVLALVLIVGGRRRLLATITAFTIAHSITLALATLGVIHAPGPPIEATIALSIVFVAAEISRLRNGISSLASTKPWIVAFTFGLLHGLGFAGALAEVGLPQGAIPLALLFFNVGVEIGQILFISVVLTVIAGIRHLIKAQPVPRRVEALPGYVIGATASFWLFERIAAFWR